MAHNHIPPLSSTDLEGRLDDDTLTVYLYIGEETDIGWKRAVFIPQLLPGVRIYLVRDRAEIEKVPEIGAFLGSKRPKALAFGFGRAPQRALTKAQAEDLEEVLTAVIEARRAP